MRKWIKIQDWGNPVGPRITKNPGVSFLLPLLLASALKGNVLAQSTPDLGCPVYLSLLVDMQLVSVEV
jgi:hypothetical protein